MKWFYIRWGGVLIVAVIIGVLGIQRYNRDVTTISPHHLLHDQPTQTVRILGMVEAGSIRKEGDGGPVAFQLSAEGVKLSVRYLGGESENLRDLKTVVVGGKWNPTMQTLEADKISVVPNYGFITAAYLASLIPMGLFLFNMERKVAMLYIQIKEEKVYQPEEPLEVR
ncbi:MAG: cytochrome c maturation protein CcmE [Candidatus Manganitrophus sp.]|nr:MAG: cytochrome c maturation protein CcmE [Candidatus Manganitrophus sp.]